MSNRKRVELDRRDDEIVVPSPPEPLGVWLATWEALWFSYGSRWDRVANFDEVWELLELMRDRKQLRDLITEDGPRVVDDRGRVFAHPLLSEFRGVSKEIRAYRKSLGIGPRNEMEVGAARVEAQRNELELMRLRQRSRLEQLEAGIPEPVEAEVVYLQDDGVLREVSADEE